MEDRFVQIGQEFNEKRDMYYRRQLQTLQIDLDYIRNADLYANKPLDDFRDDASEGAITSTAGSTQGSVRTLNLSGNSRLDIPPKSGAYAAKFAQDINDAMEQRDTVLTTIVYGHNFRIDELLRDNEFNTLVAHEEHHRLLESLRRRLIQNLNQKKAALQKEKEKLDIADTNSLLYHPNQFSFNNGASPGGLQSNRKTRHTRHRLDVDDVDVSSGNSKRKRKAPADVDNGSPAPTGREVEPLITLKEANVKLEYPQVASPLYSLDRLFSQRELDSNLQLATYDAVEILKRRKFNKDSNTNLNSIVPTNVDSSDSEDNADGGGDLDPTAEDMFLQAPEMERIPTNASQHLTRSTRGLLPKRTTGPEGLGYLAGRAAGAVSIVNAGQREKKKEDEYSRAPPLSELEQDDDLAMMKAAIEDEDAGKFNSLLLEDVEEKENYVGTGSVHGEEEDP